MLVPMALMSIQAAVFAAAILFDHTKNETAGQADWVIDNNEPTPSPAQGAIGAATRENYWTGGISAWGVGLVKLGHTVTTLASSDSITYGRAGNPRDLANFKVLVVCEPQNQFSGSEKRAIFNFVRAGGGLFMVGDHDVSDRDNDGWDSPMVWNDLGSKDSFGLYFNSTGDAANLSNFSESSRSFSTAAGDSIVSGPAGHADTLAFHNGTAITLFTALNATARNHFWRSSNSAAAMCASARFGAGRVVGVGDSSPADDSTGNPGNTLYNGWGEGEDSIVFLNATAWLAAGAAGVAGDPGAIAPGPALELRIGPNPFTAAAAIRCQVGRAGPVELAVYNIAGQKVRTVLAGVLGPGAYRAAWDGTDDRGARRPCGVYLCRLTAGTALRQQKIVLLR
jgi:hypothetical protein